MTPVRAHYTVLAGGTGAAKFLRGLVQVIPEEDIHVIVNVGDVPDPQYEQYDERESSNLNEVN